jgi:alpha-1,4-digalacturonate transport system permease protein
MTEQQTRRSSGVSTGRFVTSIADLPGALFSGVINLLDLVMHPLQDRLGVRGMAYVFVLPNLLIFGIFIMLPMLLNFYYAFTGGTNLFPQDRPFVGTANLDTLFACQSIFDYNSCREDLFWRAAFNTLIYVALQVGFMIVISLVTALALNQRIRARGFFRSVFFYPVLLSPVVVALIWKWILQQDGLLNAFIVSLGGDRVPFLLNAQWAQVWVIFISIWAQMGFFTLILLAGLQAIPSEFYEAAAIDGASRWQSFRGVTLPLLMPTLFVVVLLSLIRAVQVFDQVFPFTGGGPGTSTLYMVQYIYQTGFSNQTKEYGLAAAASLLMAVFLLILTLLQLRVARRSEVT